MVLSAYTKYDKINLTLRQIPKAKGTETRKKMKNRSRKMKNLQKLTSLTKTHATRTFLRLKWRGFKKKNKVWMA